MHGGIRVTVPGSWREGGVLPFVHQQYGTKSVNSVPRLTFRARVLHASETVSPTNCEVEVCVRSGRLLVGRT